MKQCALDFLSERQAWFFVGGQSGCGKTHICTALVGGFIKLGFSVRYLVWQEDSARLKAAILDGSYATISIHSLVKRETVRAAGKKPENIIFQSTPS